MRTNQAPFDPTSPDEPLIGVAELAVWLGVSVHAVRKWVTKGPGSGLTPKSLRINGQVKFRPNDVRDWLTTKEID